jgi:hypothetical protein
MDVDEVLAELAARAESSRWNESWTYDADAYARRAADWVAIARVTGRLRIVPAPDPRIAHAIEDVLSTTPSDNWFHADQVTHVIGSLAHDPNARTSRASPTTRSRCSRRMRIPTCRSGSTSSPTAR